MNIYTDIFALVIVLLVFMFYIFNKKSIIKINYLYLLFNICIFISIVLDIISISSGKIFHNTPPLILGRFYLASMILDAFVGLIYTLKCITKKLNIYYLISSIVLFIIGVILVFVLPTKLSLDKSNSYYLDGAAVYVAYIFAAIFILLMFICVNINISKISRKKRLGIITYCLIWYIATSYQSIVDAMFRADIKIYFGRLASAIGSLVIYALVENPENDTDSMFNLLNDHAFTEFIKDNDKEIRENDLIIISFDRTYYTTRDEFNNLLVRVLNKIEKVYYKAFKYDPYTFIFLRKPQNNLDIEVSIMNLNSSLSNFDKDAYMIHSIINVIPKEIKISSNDLLQIVSSIVKNNSIFDNTINILNEEKISSLIKNLRMSEIIDYAIKFDSIQVNYQGIFSLEKNKFVSCEALTRIIDQNGNIIYPSDFIEMIESDGRIIELSYIIFDHICKFITTDDFKKLGLDYIEVNLSPAQMDEPNIVRNYLDITKKYNVDPKFINLEITETSKGTSKVIIDKMNKFKEYGFTFSLDDFGTGNSNLNYIVSLPINIVKFDKSMVTSYFNNDTTRLVVNHSIKMIKELGLKIVFEGIETKEEVEIVKKMPVDYIQGYFYSRPINEINFIKLVNLTNNKIEK